MIPKKHAPDLNRSGRRFSEKIMLPFYDKQARRAVVGIAGLGRRGYGYFAAASRRRSLSMVSGVSLPKRVR